MSSVAGAQTAIRTTLGWVVAVVVLHGLHELRGFCLHALHTAPPLSG